MIDAHERGLLPYLLGEWSTLSLLIQEHLAYILGESNGTAERALIQDMMKSETESVSWRAGEALKALLDIYRSGAK